MGRFFRSDVIGVVRAKSVTRCSEDDGFAEFHGGWVLVETFVVLWRKRRAIWFGRALAASSNSGQERSAAVDCWLKGGPVPTQYLEVPPCGEPKPRDVGGTGC